MDLFLTNKSKLENFQFGLFENIEQPVVSMKQLPKKPTVRKAFFFKFQKN